MKRVFCLAVAVLTLLSTISPLARAEDGQQIERLVVALNSDESYMTPYTYEHEDGCTLFKLTYDPLFSLDENGNPEPWLAKEYSCNDDYTEFTVTIYDNVTFHDGEPLTAEDVKFTFEYLQKYEKSRFSTPAAYIDSMELDGDYTVTFHLSAPQPEFLNKPLAEMGILPEHIWKDVTEPTAFDNTIGSGPYKLVDTKIGEYYLFEANDNYFRGTPVAKQIYMPVMKDKSAIFTAMQAGEVDATPTTLPVELLEQFENNSNIGIIQVTGYSTNQLFFNCERYPFDIPQFRKALAMAVNTQELTDVVMLGSATAGGLGFVHPEHPTYNPNINALEFDLEGAAAILDELNFVDTDGDGIRETDTGEKLSFEIITASNSPQRIRSAEIIKEWYAEIGVEITVTSVDFSIVIEKVWPEYTASNGRDFDMTIFGWGATTMGVVTRYVECFYSDLEKGNSNLNAYANPDMDALLDKMAVEIDQEQLETYIDEMQQILSEDYSHVSLFYPTLICAYNSNKMTQWHTVKGVGIVNHQSFVRPFGEGGSSTDAASPGSSDAANGAVAEEENHHQMAPWGWAVLAVPIVIVVIILLKNRKKRA